MPALCLWGRTKDRNDGRRKAFRIVYDLLDDMAEIDRPETTQSHRHETMGSPQTTELGRQIGRLANDQLIENNEAISDSSSVYCPVLRGRQGQ